MLWLKVGAGLGEGEGKRQSQIPEESQVTDNRERISVGRRRTTYAVVFVVVESQAPVTLQPTKL